VLLDSELDVHGRDRFCLIVNQFVSVVFKVHNNLFYLWPSYALVILT